MEPEGSLPHSQQPTSLSLSWVTAIYTLPPHPTPRRSILIFAAHLRLGLPSGLFPSGLPTKTLYAPLLSSICASYLAHLIILDLITRMIFGDEYRVQSSLLCSLLQSPVTLSLIGPNIFLITLFMNTLRLYSFFSVRDQDSHPYKTKGKTAVLYILIHTHTYRVSQEEWTKLWESVPYVKIYRYNPKHLCPKLNGYGDKGQRKVWSFCSSTYCTWFAWRNTHTLRIVCPCLQLAQTRSSLRLHM